MKDPNRKICNRCVMDDTDPLITFRSDGVCSHCENFEQNAQVKLKNNNIRELDETIDKIISSTDNNRYHCIIGLSGGLDSSYLAYFLRNRYPNLRILAVHVDCGWNSPEAVNNIEVLVRKLDLDYVCKVLDWNTVKNLQLAYLKSGVPNQDIPQDYAFYVGVYEYAKLYKIKYYLNGGNLVSEAILPSAWGYDNKDSKQLISINRSFGDGLLRGYQTFGYFKTYIYHRFVYRLDKIRPLNFIDYDLSKAKQVLIKELGWQDYGGKHHESRFTRFFQAYYLPNYFGYDKRKAHLSSLINSGKISRAEAALTLESPLYTPHTLKLDKRYMARKLELSETEFENLLVVEKQSHDSLPSWKLQNRLLRSGLKILRRSLDFFTRR